MYQHKEPNIKIIYGGGGCVWISGFGCSVFITFFFSYNDLCNMRYGIIKPLWTFKVDMEDSIIWQMEWNEIGLTFTLTLYVYIKAITRFFSHWIYSPHWKQMIKTQIIIIPNKTKPDDLIFVTVCFPFLCWGFLHHGYIAQRFRRQSSIIATAATKAAEQKNMFYRNFYSSRCHVCTRVVCI